MPRKDYIFRFAPTDFYQMRAQARFLWDVGIRYFAIAQVVGQAPEEDVQVLRNTWSQMGGISSDPIKYDPSEKEFSTEVLELNSLVQSAINQYGKAKVAIEFVGYEEVAIWLNEAKDYPALMSVMWISNDGVAQSTVVLQEAGALAARVLLPCTLFGATNSLKYQNITARLQAATGLFPSTYALVAYDELWIIAYALIMTQKYDGPTLVQYIPIVADSYFGASGWTALDMNGDRAFGDYDLWAITINATNGQPTWTKIASWSAATDTISWTHGVVGLPSNSTLPAS
jgi:branched-chain amino acid transport system substrate-binding protein